jgi:probable HAF family extracellular repeat protein
LFVPGNWGLYLPDTQLYHEADVDGDGFICELALTGTAGFSQNPVKEVVDLGTLGGHSFARAVNEDGMVVGGSFTAAGVLHPFVWTKKEGMQDFGSPHPGFQCEARAAPGTGAFVGRCCEVFDPQTLECEGPGEHIFTWSSPKKTWTLTIPLADDICEDAAAFAFLSTAVGGCQFQADRPMNAAWWGWNAPPQAFPGTDPERFSVALAAAPDAALGAYRERYRFVAGEFETASGDRHAFVYRQPVGGLVPPNSGSIRDLGTLGGSSSKANGVNIYGQVVGVSETASGEQHAFLWTESGGIVDLGTLGGGMSIATGINDQGQVVGYTGAYSTVVGFLWTAQEGMVALQPLVGAGGWAALAISNKGVVVGTSAVSAPGNPLHATMWVLK